RVALAAGLRARQPAQRKNEEHPAHEIEQRSDILVHESPSSPAIHTHRRRQRDQPDSSVTAGAAKKTMAAAHVAHPSWVAPRKASTLPMIGTKARMKPATAEGHAPQSNAR